VIFNSKESSRPRDAIANMRDACATQRLAGTEFIGKLQFHLS
jgi:hypothetical protein